MNTNKLVYSLTVSLLAAAMAYPALGQTTYTWQLPGAGTWSTTGNWSPSGAPGAADTANINTTTVMTTGSGIGSTITYDSASTGTLTNLNMVNTTTNASTVLQLAKVLTITGAGLLENTSSANSGSGYQAINLAGNTLNIGSSTDTDATLTFGSSTAFYGSGSVATIPTIYNTTGTSNINVYGAINFVASSNANYYTVGVNGLSGVTTGTSETITLEGAGSSLNFSNATSTNARLYIYGSLIANTESSITSTGADASHTTLYFYGATNTIGTGVTLPSLANPFTQFQISNKNTTVQTISVGTPFQFQLQDFKAGTATVNVIVPQQYTSTAAGNAVDQLLLYNNNDNNSTHDVQLGSNLVLAPGQLYPFAIGTASTTNITGENELIDLNGYSYDASASANGFTFQGWVNGGAAPTVPLPVYLNNSSSTTSSTITAANFNLSTADVSIGNSLTPTGASTLASNKPITLLATGTGVTNDLGTVTLGSLPALTINPNTLFYYTGSGSANLKTTGGRAVGQVTVGTGTSASTLVLTSAITSASGLTVNAGAALDLGGLNYTENEASSTATAGGLSGSGTVENNVSGSTSTLTLDTTNADGSFSGSIVDHGTGTGVVALVKNGGGTQTLSGANSFTGPTQVNGGTLLLTSTGSLASPVTVSNAGTKLYGAGTINGAVSLGAGTTLYSGGSATGTTPSVSANSKTSTTGMTLSSSLGVSSANLTFALGSDTTSSGFDTPSYNSTYMNVGGVVTFSGTDTITLVDLTNTLGTNGSLALRQGTAYVLIANSLGDAGFSGLVTVQGTGDSAVYQLDGDGYVVGVAGAGWTSADGASNTTAIQIKQVG
ncbi:MAG TPA: autotransporter-associated beta strand repeat-containing protein, partial [Candidatus Methylacidiphilales bacterium]